MPVAAVHLDLARAPEQLDRALEAAPSGMTLSLGVIDGRNVWRSDLERSLGLLEKAAAKLGSDRIMVAPSCSLLHCPIDLDNEPALDSELKSWMAFAKQKLQEVAILTKALNRGRAAVADELAASRAAVESRARFGPPAQSGRPTARGRRRRGHASPPASAPRSARGPAAPPLPAAAAHHDHRLFPADQRSAQSPRARSRRASGRSNATKRSARRKSSGRSAFRRKSGSTCWSTASSSGPTWSSISASSWKASRGRPTAGCKATARFASSRRSSSATCRGRGR